MLQAMGFTIQKKDSFTRFACHKVIVCEQSRAEQRALTNITNFGEVVTCEQHIGRLDIQVYDAAGVQ